MENPPFLCIHYIFLSSFICISSVDIRYLTDGLGTLSPSLVKLAEMVNLRQKGFHFLATYDFREYNSVEFDIYEPNILKIFNLMPSCTFPCKKSDHLGKLNAFGIQGNFFHFFVYIYFYSGQNFVKIITGVGHKEDIDIIRIEFNMFQHLNMKSWQTWVTVIGNDQFSTHTHFLPAHQKMLKIYKTSQLKIY